MNRSNIHPTYRSGRQQSSALLSIALGSGAALLLAFGLWVADNFTEITRQPAPTAPLATPIVMQIEAQTPITPTPDNTAVPITPTATAIPPTLTPIPSPTQVPLITQPHGFWLSEFFNNPDLDGTPVVQRNDVELNFNYQTGAADPRLPADNFSARFSGIFNFDQTENIEFSLVVDDAARVYIDDRLIIDEWHMGGRRTAKVNVPVLKGEHTLRVDYAETTGVAMIALNWRVNYDAWKCRYYNSTDWTGPVMLRTNEGIKNGKLIQDWGDGGPGYGVNTDGFSADCVTTISVPKTGTYNFKLLADDGMRVFVDGVSLYDNLNGPIQPTEVPVRLRAGRHTIQTQYIERTGSAAQHIEWDYVPPPPATPVPTPLSGS